MPDRVISVPQASQIATRIKNKFDNVNGRLVDVEEDLNNAIDTRAFHYGYEKYLYDRSIWEGGGIDTITGDNISQTSEIGRNRARSKEYVTGIDCIKWLPASGDWTYTLSVYLYDSNDTFVRALTRLTSYEEFDYTQYKYRIVFARNTNESIDVALNRIVCLANKSPIGAELESVSVYFEKIVFPTPNRMYYVTNGTTFDINTRPSVVADTYWQSVVIPCAAGEGFILSGTGGSQPRLYAFVGSDGTILLKSASGYSADSLNVIAPEGSAYLVINNNDSTKESYRVCMTSQTVSAQENTEPTSKRLVNAQTILASFTSITGTSPKLFYENNVRSFGFYVTDGAKYRVKLKNNSRACVGFIKDKIEIVKSGHDPINLNGIFESESNEFEFRTYGVNTCFIYGSADIATYDAEIEVVELLDGEEWTNKEAETLAYADDITHAEPLFGTPKFYLSDAVAETPTYITDMPVADLYAMYDALCTRFPHLIHRAADIGMDASNTFEIREYVVKFQNPLITNGEVALTGDIDLETVTNLWRDSFSNNVFALASGVHGNEKAAAYGLALAIEEILASDEDYAVFIRSNFELHIVPCVNPYGFNEGIRRNSNDVDINRDFRYYHEAETQAFRDWITPLAPRCVAFLDSHGTTGYYPYFEITSVDPYYDGMNRLFMRFTTAIQNNWKAFYNSFSLDKYPYCYAIRGNYSNTKGQLINQLGIPCLTTETPQNFTNGGTSVWLSNIQSCKFTKDMIINMVQLMGEWGSRIKSKSKNRLLTDGF